MKEVVSMFEPIYNDGGDTIYLVDQLEDKKVIFSDNKARNKKYYYYDLLELIR